MIYTVIKSESDGYDGHETTILMVTSDKEKAINYARTKLSENKPSYYYNGDAITVEAWDTETESKEVFEIWIDGIKANKTIKERIYK
jgi:hypothetical protein